MYVCMYICMYTYMYVYINIYIYIYKRKYMPIITYLPRACCQVYFI